MFSSNKISQHNLNSNVPRRLSAAYALFSFCTHAVKTDHICHAQYSNYCRISNNSYKMNLASFFRKGGVRINRVMNY